MRFRPKLFENINGMLKLKVSTSKIINLLINRRIVNLFYPSRFQIDFSEAKSFPTK